MIACPALCFWDQLVCLTAALPAAAPPLGLFFWVYLANCLGWLLRCHLVPCFGTCVKLPSACKGLLLCSNISSGCCLGCAIAGHK
jgi:hypothetical protein